MVLYTFPGTHAVIFAEQVLQEAAVPVTVLPVPDTITAGCGLCIEILPEDRQRAENGLKACGVEISAIYEKKEGSYQPAGS